MVRAACDLRMWEQDSPTPRDLLLREAAECEGILALLTEKIDPEVLAAAPRLKVISNMAVGYDNIDIPAATARRIPVGNTPGVLTETTADFAFALLMAAARRLAEGDRYVRAGAWRTWSPKLLMGQDVYGATLGIIGFGRIGQAVARRARGFDMHVLFHGGSNEQAARELGAERRSLDDLLRESDFVSLHAPLKDETYHLIGERELKLMKPTAALVTTARGPVVSPQALSYALSEGWIGYAARDVTDGAFARRSAAALDNCLIVPHVAPPSPPR
jgi:glyoxylate reductase